MAKLLARWYRGEIRGKLFSTGSIYFYVGVEHTLWDACLPLLLLLSSWGHCP